MDASALKAKLQKVMKGEVEDSEKARRLAARDTSLFERVPALVCYPTDAADVSAIVQVVRKAHEAGEEGAVLAARAAGTDMSGGPLTTGIVISFTEHMNKVLNVAPLKHVETHHDGYAYTEPGAYYRDFEKATLAKGLILPSYPASREIVSMGGIVAKNSGG